MGTSALQRELDRFFKELSQGTFNVRKITKGGFSQARKNLKAEAFLELNDIVCTEFYQEMDYIGYKNHRLLAADGSRVVLPDHSSIIKEFGSNGFGPKGDSDKSMAILSLLYDPVNGLALDAQITGFSGGGSEHDLLLKHLEKVNSGDLLLMDRGYPNKGFFSLLGQKGIHFCVRMKATWWKDVRAFSESNEEDIEVTFELSEKELDKYREDYPELPATVRSRLVKVKLDTGETEILCTSLLDKQIYPIEDFKELYHCRWGVEEGCFKMLKSRVNLEAFTGKTALAVKQDIFAKVFMMSLCAAYAFPIDEKIKKEYEKAKKQGEKHSKYKQKINRTNAISNIKNIIIPLFLRQMVKESIIAFDNIVYRTQEIIRPDRKFPRNHKPNREYYMNYKHL